MGEKSIAIQEQLKSEAERIAKFKTSNGHTVHARSVVIATNTPVNDRFIIATKQAPYRTYW